LRKQITLFLFRFFKRHQRLSPHLFSLVFVSREKCLE
jgi:hypothetical protein